MDGSLNSAEVKQLLDIKQQTLYAYVSRGLLRRTSAPNSKRSLYAREDVEKLLARKLERSASADPADGAVPAGTLAVQPAGSGSETLTSAITEIKAQGLRYRGRDVRTLAVHPGCLENIAELLWTGVLSDEPVLWEYDEIPANVEPVVAALQRGEGQVPMLRVMVAATLALGESAAAELRSGNTARLARRLVTTYAGCLGYARPKGNFMRPREGDSIAGLAARALAGKPSAELVAALNATMIWCADHELTPPTYTARIIASTGAGLHACLVGAMAGQSGQLLGGGCDRVEQFVAGRPAAERWREMVQAARNGGWLPGFGHPLYPLGDPRAAALLELAGRIAPAKAIADIVELVEIAGAEADLKPSLELGLVAVSRALDLPPRAASSLWAVGRSVGWVAHVMEQRLAGKVIRPRARRAPG